MKIPLNITNIFFRIIAFLEGLSYIALLFIAVPLKYCYGNELYVKILGMPHGLLFMTYIVLACLLKESKNWNLKDITIVLLASILPFGTFYIEWKYF